LKKQGPRWNACAVSRGRFLACGGEEALGLGPLMAYLYL
jgi:hypothetical protein